MVAVAPAGGRDADEGATVAALERLGDLDALAIAVAVAFRRFPFVGRVEVVVTQLARAGFCDLPSFRRPGALALRLRAPWRDRVDITIDVELNSSPSVSREVLLLSSKGSSASNSNRQTLPDVDGAWRWIPKRCSPIGPKRRTTEQGTWTITFIRCTVRVSLSSPAHDWPRAHSCAARRVHHSWSNANAPACGRFPRLA